MNLQNANLQNRIFVKNSNCSSAPNILGNNITFKIENIDTNYFLIDVDILKCLYSLTPSQILNSLPWNVYL